MSAVQRINALTQEQRDQAYQQTRHRIAGEPPSKTQNAERKYPRWMQGIIVFLCGVMLVAAFIPSAMRLNAIALDINRWTMTHELSLYAAALCVVLMAEVGQVIFSLAATNADGKVERLALWSGSLICLVIALVGNGVAEGEHAWRNALAPLVTFAPPVLVLITANVLKRQMLKAIEHTQTMNAAFEKATHAWQSAYANAHLDASWDRTLANTLKDALRSANKQSKAVLRDLDASDWRTLVMRERSAEEWWDHALPIALTQSPPIQPPDAITAPIALSETHRPAQRSGSQSTASTGEAVNAALRMEGDLFVKTCPQCGREFKGETQRSATNRLVAHLKAHVTPVQVKAVAPIQGIPEPIVSMNGNGHHEV